MSISTLDGVYPDACIWTDDEDCELCSNSIYWCDRCETHVEGDNNDLRPSMVYGENTKRELFDDGHYWVCEECLTPEEDKIWEQTIEREG